VSEGPAARAARAASPRAGLTHALLPLALLGTFAAQARTLSFYFFQDDYVPFGEIAKNGTSEYLWRLVLARDLTPNWRVIPGVMYLASDKLFGMTPLPMHIAMLLLHLGTVALIYRIVARATGRAWAAFAAALVFGLHPGYAGALGQVAVVPHIASAFFLAAALNAVFECARARRRPVADAWWAASVLCYVLALMSNESMAAVFPAFALAFLLFDGQREGRVTRAAVRAVPFAVIGFAAALAVKACDCTEASSVYSLDHAPRVFLIYAGRLLYPIGLEPPSYIDPPHLYASIVLLGAAAWLLARGPAIGRVGAAWMLLAIVPHIFVEDHTANRFTYLATPGFAMLAAGCAMAVEPHMRRVHAMAPALAGAAVLALVAPWYATQTHLQNEPWRRITADWRHLHDELRRTYPEVPPGARVEVIGGRLTHPLDNFFVMPALGWTIWSPAVTLQTFSEDDPYAAKVRASGNPYAAEFRDRLLVPLTTRE
jgi:hypothetical protein